MIWVVAASVIFGINPTLISMSMERGMDSVSQVFWMYLINCIINCLMCRGAGISLKLGWKKSLLLMFCGMVGMGWTGCLLAISYQTIGTGTSTILHFMYPAVVSVAACLILKKIPKRKTILAIILSVCGVVMLVQVKNGQRNGTNVLPALLSSCTYSFYFLVNSHPAVCRIPHQLRCTWMSAGIWISFGVYLIAKNQITLPQDWEGAGLIVLSGCASAAAYNCLVLGIGKIGAMRSACASLLEPITSMIMGILIGGEIFTLKKGIGSILILISVFLNSLTK